MCRDKAEVESCRHLLDFIHSGGSSLPTGKWQPAALHSPTVVVVPAAASHTPVVHSYSDPSRCLQS